jgi:Domain of unknown function (DUF4158)
VPGAAELQAADWEAARVWQQEYDAKQARAAAVAAMRNDIIAENDDGGDVTAWLADARRKDEIADEKRILTADAKKLVRATTLELETVQDGVRADHARWLRYDESLPAATPDARIAEEDRLRAIISDAEPLASRADEAAMAADVAHEVVLALEDMQPIRLAQVWLAAEAPKVEQATIESLRIHYAKLAAMEEAAEPTWDQAQRMRELGVSVPSRRLKGRSVDLPPLITTRDETGFAVVADPCAVTGYRVAIAQLGEFPLPTIQPPTTPPQPTGGHSVSCSVNNARVELLSNGIWLIRGSPCRCCLAVHNRRLVVGRRRTALARRRLLTDEERRFLLGVPCDPESLARHYTFTRSDQELISSRHGAANRLGFAVQLALLRHPGRTLPQMDEPVEALVDWLAARLEIPAMAFTEYARRPQTMTDHARILATTLGLRPAVSADLPAMIEAAAQCAWSTDRGQPIVAGVIAALHASKIILPAPGMIERAAIAGRARARKRATDALLANISSEQMTKIDDLLTVDPTTGLSQFAWLKKFPVSPRRTTSES